MTIISANLIIPAYTHHNQGLYTQLLLRANPSTQLTVSCEGHIANALKKIFCRTIDILTTLQASYLALQRFEYTLISPNQTYRVGDVRSASLAICITLLNVLRQHAGKMPIDSIVGTGILRLDGSFQASAFEQLKQNAIKHAFACQKQFINSQHCHHVFDLEILLNSCL